MDICTRNFKNLERRKMMEKEIIDYIEELSIKCTEEYNEIRSRAYNVKIEDNYAIALRDEFNKNAGKYEIVTIIK